MKFLKKFATRAEYEAYMASNESFPFVGYIKEEKAVEYTGAPAVTTIVIDQNLTDPALMISGDVNGDVIKSIRQQSHRYLGKYTSEGTMTLCQLDDSDSNFYADGTASVLTGAQGDVFMKMPKFYFKAEEIDEDRWAISFSETRISAEWNEWNGNALIGVYQASEAGTKLYSRSGLANVVSITQPDAKSYARARGNGFQLVDWQMHCVMALLFFAEYGHTDAQAKVGAGTSSYKNSGQTDSNGMADTKGASPIIGLNDNGANGNSQSINFWGLENWWGNNFEWVDNVIVNYKSWEVTEQDGSERTAGSSAGSSATIGKMAFGTKCDLIPIGLASEGTGFCDFYGYNNSSSRIVTRSFYGNASDGGLTTVQINSGLTSKGSNITSRLAFRGNCVIEPSSEAFKALTAIA